MNNKEKLKSNMLLATYIVVLSFLLLNIKDVLNLFAYILGILNPFLLAIAIAFVLNLPMKFFDNKLLAGLDKNKSNFVKNLKRPLAIILALFSVIGVITGIIIYVIPQLSESISTLIKIIPESIKSFEELMTQNSSSINILNEVWNQILVMWKEIIQILGQVTGALLTQLLDITIGVTSTIANFFVALVLSIYMLSSKEKLILQIKKFLYAFTNKKVSDKTIEIARISNKMFSNFVAGQIIEAIIIGILCFIGMSIFRMPYALLISVIISVTALIPVFGAFIGTIPSAFIILMVEPITALWFLVLIIVIQQIEGNLIYPRVVGNSLGLSGIWVMFAMLIGGSTFGLLGMLLGIPLFGVIYTVLGALTNNRLKSKSLEASE